MSSIDSVLLVVLADTTAVVDECIVTLVLE